MQLHKGVADGLSLADVTCPTLVVHSEGDPVPEEFSRLLADKIAAAEYQLINRASHFVHFEDAESLKAAVLPFLRAFAR
jgi:pimeloyl-ACP methyl ester carboxylesterase